MSGFIRWCKKLLGVSLLFILALAITLGVLALLLTFGTAFAVVLIVLIVIWLVGLAVSKPRKEEKEE